MLKFGWGGGRGSLANKSCGVEIWLNRRRFRRSHLQHFWPVQSSLHGRLGAMRVKSSQVDHSDRELLPPEVHGGQGHSALRDHGAQAD
eukprot:9479373-Pyramimonas_sp.AAC.2